MSSQTISTHVIPDDMLSVQTPHVLLLEDDPYLAQTLQQFLRTEGCEVTHCRYGTQGLRAVLKKEFHVILCDMVMPGFPGDMFYTAVKQSRPHLCERFIFMTGHRADRRIDQFIRSVRGLMLWKPFPMHELLGAIQQVLRKVNAHRSEPLDPWHTASDLRLQSQLGQPWHLQPPQAFLSRLPEPPCEDDQDDQDRVRAARQSDHPQAVNCELAPTV